MPGPGSAERLCVATHWLLSLCSREAAYVDVVFSLTFVSTTTTFKESDRPRRLLGRTAYAACPAPGKGPRGAPDTTRRPARLMLRALVITG